MSGMVERAARAVCALHGVAADVLADEQHPPVPAWRTFVPIVETVLNATTLPAVPLLGGGPPEAHPD